MLLNQCTLISSKSHKASLYVGAIIIPFHRWGNWSSEREWFVQGHCSPLWPSHYPALNTAPGFGKQTQTHPPPKCSQVGRKRQDKKPGRNKLHHNAPLPLPSFCQIWSNLHLPQEVSQGSRRRSGPFLFVSLNEFMSPHCSSFPMAGGSQGSSLGYSFPNWKMSLRSPSTIEIQDFFFFFFFFGESLEFFWSSIKAAAPSHPVSHQTLWPLWSNPLRPWPSYHPLSRLDRDNSIGLHTAAWKKVQVAQSCPTLCDPMDCSPPGTSIHGILQARMPEWVAVPFCSRCLSDLLKNREFPSSPVVSTRHSLPWPGFSPSSGN